MSFVIRVNGTPVYTTEDRVIKAEFSSAQGAGGAIGVEGMIPGVVDIQLITLHSDETGGVQVLQDRDEMNSRRTREFAEKHAEERGDSEFVSGKNAEKINENLAGYDVVQARKHGYHSVENYQRAKDAGLLDLDKPPLEAGLGGTVETGEIGEYQKSQFETLEDNAREQSETGSVSGSDSSEPAKQVEDSTAASGTKKASK